MLLWRWRLVAYLVGLRSKVRFWMKPDYDWMTGCFESLGFRTLFDSSTCLLTAHKSRCAGHIARPSGNAVDFCILSRGSCEARDPILQSSSVL